MDCVDNLPSCYEHITHRLIVDNIGIFALFNISTSPTTTTAIYLKILRVIIKKREDHQNETHMCQK